jgi:hypothetical protein
MASASGQNPNTSQELVIYELTGWELVYARDEIDRPSKTIKDPPAWVIQLFSSLKKAENDVRLLAEARENQDGMELDITDLKSYYEALSHNSSGFFLGNFQKYLSPWQVYSGRL